MRRREGRLACVTVVVAVVLAMSGCGLWRPKLAGTWLSKTGRGWIEFTDNGAATLTYRDTTSPVPIPAMPENTQVDLGFLLLEYREERTLDVLVGRVGTEPSRRIAVRCAPRDPNVVPWTKVLIASDPQGRAIYPLQPGGRTVAAYKAANATAFAVTARVADKVIDLKRASLVIDAVGTDLAWHRTLRLTGTYTWSGRDTVDIWLPIGDGDESSGLVGHVTIGSKGLHLDGRGLTQSASIDYERSTPESLQAQGGAGEQVADYSVVAGVRASKSSPVYVNTGFAPKDGKFDTPGKDSAAIVQFMLFRLPGVEAATGVVATEPPKTDRPVITIKTGDEQIGATRAFSCGTAEAGQTVLVAAQGILFPFKLDKSMSLCFGDEAGRPVNTVSPTKPPR